MLSRVSRNRTNYLRIIQTYAEFMFYNKHHLKFGKNQADNLVAVENRFICDFGADFFLYFIGV